MRPGIDGRTAPELDAVHDRHQPIGEGQGGSRPGSDRLAGRVLEGPRRPTVCTAETRAAWAPPNRQNTPPRP